MKKNYILLITFFIVSIANAQWDPQNSGTTNDLRSVHFTNANTGYTVGDNGILLKTIDGGENWISQDISTTGNLYDVHFCTDTTGFIAGAEGIFKTIDGGNQWYQVDTNYYKQINFVDVNTGYASASDLYKTIDGGETWTLLDQSNFLITSFFFLTPDTGYLASAEDGIYFTSDGGYNWTLQYDLGIEGAWLYSMYFISPDTGFAVGEIGPTMMMGGMYKTFDGGTNWNWETIYDNTNYNIYFSDINTGYIVGHGGMIYTTTNGGYSWTGTTYLSWWEDLYSVYFPVADTGYAVGSDGIILKTTNGGTVGVNKEKYNNSLFQFFPNPAYDRVDVLLTELNSNTQLSIWNINGQEKIKIPITKYETTIDLSNLTNGIYFIKISTTSMTRTEILIKE